MSKRKCDIGVSSSDNEDDEELQQPRPKKPTAGFPSQDEDRGFDYTPLLNVPDILTELGTYNYNPASPRTSADEDEDSKSEYSDDEMPLCNIYYCFLEKITSPTSIYTTNFQEKKHELTASLYQLYNQTIFENKLPQYMRIIWNKRLRTTAGNCHLMKADDDGRSCIIHLSERLVDSAERLRDILVHEMCHAACWLIDRQAEGEDPHGALWSAYAAKVTDIHPELPKVVVQYAYAIKYPYNYQCSLCQHRSGRFRKLDTEKENTTTGGWKRPSNKYK